jgi:hypothetical protein
MDGQNRERRLPMFQVRNFLSVTGSFLKRIIAASTIAAVVSVSTMVIGILLMALAGAGGSLIIDGSQAFQSIDGFGVNANSASWKNGELRPAIDMLVDQLGATISGLSSITLIGKRSMILMVQMRSIGPPTMASTPAPSLRNSGASWHTSIKRHYPEPHSQRHGPGRLMDGGLAHRPCS